ncbi:23122_t:CDS:2 [Dentiscutata erythropus]|uniref:23122_t:CDS:1 n=1 Tax=Dentiscutata erythropus TaxID=1348616 RepID=A0A9N8ZZV2_9GLOM|nr:23122_t:CDS:2 [Dentiscutata erythropus]
MGLNFLNLEDQLAFYGQYHNNKVNVAIHIVFVPLILWTTLVVAANSGPLLPYDPNSVLNLIPLVPNAALLIVLFYITFYLLLEPVAGALYAPLLLYLAYNATNFAAAYPNNITIASIVHVISWIIQFIGHGFFERRSPALKDNVVQALLLAPLFVWLEILFTFRYRKDLQKRVKDKVGKAITKFRIEQRKKVE